MEEEEEDFLFSGDRAEIEVARIKATWPSIVRHFATCAAVAFIVWCWFYFRG